MYGCYAVATNVRTLCRLGYGATPFGTEGYIRGMWFRDCASQGGGWALDLQSNVGFFDLISIYGNNLANQNLLRLSGGGGGNMFSKIAIIGAGPNCSSFYCNGPGTMIDGLEIEAPGSTSHGQHVVPPLPRQQYGHPRTDVIRSGRNRSGRVDRVWPRLHGLGK